MLKFYDTSKIPEFKRTFNTKLAFQESLFSNFLSFAIELNGNSSTIISVQLIQINEEGETLRTISMSSSLIEYDVTYDLLKNSGEAFEQIKPGRYQIVITTDDEVYQSEPFFIWNNGIVLGAFYFVNGGEWLLANNSNLYSYDYVN